MIRKGEYKNNPALKGNNFTKGNYKIGDRVKILEYVYQNKEYINYKIIDILDKGSYNMYLCESKKGFKTTFTDKDLLQKEQCYNGSRKYVVRG